MRINKDRSVLGASDEAFADQAPSEDGPFISDLADLEVENDTQIKGGEFAGQTVRIQFRSTSDL